MSYSLVFTLAQAKKNKEAEMRRRGAELMSQIASPYTPEERDTWPTQVAEAKAYLTDPNTLTPMLSAITAVRGNTVADQVARILANESAFKVAVGQILGIQQTRVDQIAIAATTEAVAGVVW